jgi:hypothetical protein
MPQTGRGHGSVEGRTRCRGLQRAGEGRRALQDPHGRRKGRSHHLADIRCPGPTQPLQAHRDAQVMANVDYRDGFLVQGASATQGPFVLLHCQRVRSRRSAARQMSGSDCDRDCRQRVGHPNLLPEVGGHAEIERLRRPRHGEITGVFEARLVPRFQILKTSFPSMVIRKPSYGDTMNSTRCRCSPGLTQIE